MQPLASILRPKRLNDFIGQKHLVGLGGPIRKMLETGNISSMIFWGPPASGKTTLAEIISNSTKSDFQRLSAVMDGKEALKKVIEKARLNQENDLQTILFIDEIHRWNKSQQDSLLPFVESGEITLIGATTENPSFEIISPLLSRSRVFVFESHTPDDIIEGLNRGVQFLKLTIKFEIDTEIVKYLATLSNGDIRFALNTLQVVVNSNKSEKITREYVEQSAQKYLRYDKDGEEHYNLISAVHKSLRSGNSSASVYWIVRMLEGGEDPIYIARRLIRFASEDIGNANPTALLMANMVFDTCQKIGYPECSTALVQLADYLARCPKNNKAYTAYSAAKSDIKKYGNLAVPLHFRNAPTKLMKDLGYGENYEYDHNLEGKKSNQECFPIELKGRDYFND